MKIKCIFGSRGDDTTPELIDAWDGYTIDENESGWFETVNEAKARKEYVDIRVITFNVSDKLIENVFKETKVEATIVDE